VLSRISVFALPLCGKGKHKAKETIDPTNSDITRVSYYQCHTVDRNVKANAPLSLGSHRASLPGAIFFLMTVCAPHSVLRVAPGRKPPASVFYPILSAACVSPLGAGRRFKRGACLGGRRASASNMKKARTAAGDGAPMWTYSINVLFKCATRPQ
jgi:hypothetical protein